jgi:hypothetical protein
VSNAGNSRISIMQEQKKRFLAVLTLAKGAVIDDAIRRRGQLIGRAGFPNTPASK